MGKPHVLPHGQTFRHTLSSCNTPAAAKPTQPGSLKSGSAVKRVRVFVLLWNVEAVLFFFLAPPVVWGAASLDLGRWSVCWSAK